MHNIDMVGQSEMQTNTGLRTAAVFGYMQVVCKHTVKEIFTMKYCIGGKAKYC